MRDLIVFLFYKFSADDAEYGYHSASSSSGQSHGSPNGGIAKNFGHQNELVQDNFVQKPERLNQYYPVQAQQLQPEPEYCSGQPVMYSPTHHPPAQASQFGPNDHSGVGTIASGPSIWTPTASRAAIYGYSQPV